jgi:hypothetical protein
VTEVGRRYAHDLGDRRLGDLLLQEDPNLLLLAVELGCGVPIATEKKTRMAKFS